MWMNEYEIQDAVQRISSPPSFVEGAYFLSRFCDLINSISDGWPYWSYGTKCSDDLQNLIGQVRHPNNPVDTRKVKPAIKKVLTFLKRCKQTKDTEAVIEFVYQWEEIIA